MTLVQEEPGKVVRVVDNCPVYRHGLIRALEEAGYRVDQEGCPEFTLTVAVVRSDEDLDGVVRPRNDLPVVVILKDARPERCAEALAAGACAVIAENAPVAALLEAVEAALQGRTTLPIAIAQQLARGTARRGPPLSAEEVEWLQELAHGVPIARLAEEACHSERDMYRVLHRLYARIGVTGRAEAIVAATRWGLVD